jgi:DNA-binding CsgD family transcriptional regulator
MSEPVNFDSVSLDGILSDWLGALHEFAVEAVAVLGPDPFGGFDDRHVLCVHPPVVEEVVSALAQSGEFGAQWRGCDAPLVVWQHIAKGGQPGGGDWRSLALARGFHTLVRVEFPLPAGRAFECFMFSPREFPGRTDAALLVWSTLNIWPVVKRGIAEGHSTLSPRERECLVLAFSGLTARESSARLSCTERTVNYHLANAMAKLKVDNKLAAIQRACWIGAI